MGEPLVTDISDFKRRDFTFGGSTKPVLITGEIGPAVVVIHEIYGFTPTVARLCRWLRGAGFVVYAPILFGRPDAMNEERRTLRRMLNLCISHEFTMFVANRSSPVVSWLKPLARQAHQECGGRGVGVIGLCFTGGFALSMAVDSAVMAPVMGEPGLLAFHSAELEISPDELNRVKERAAAEGLTVYGYRFESDRLCKAERFATLQGALGSAFVGKEIPDEAANPNGLKAKGQPPHSVFTTDLIDEDGQPTREAVNEIITFFQCALKPSHSGENQRQ
jgi:dienelactone hydrolase